MTFAAGRCAAPPVGILIASTNPRSIDLPGIDLSGIEVSGIDVSGIDLSGIDNRTELVGIDDARLGISAGVVRSAHAQLFAGSAAPPTAAVGTAPAP